MACRADPKLSTPWQHCTRALGFADTSCRSIVYDLIQAAEAAYIGIKPQRQIHRHPCRADPRSPSTPWRRSTRDSAAARHEARRSRAGGKRSADDLAALAREAAAARRLGRHVRQAAK